MGRLVTDFLRNVDQPRCETIGVILVLFVAVLEEAGKRHAGDLWSSRGASPETSDVP